VIKQQPKNAMELLLHCYRAIRGRYARFSKQRFAAL
jgi:hypothetical protein